MNPQDIESLRNAARRGCDDCAHLAVEGIYPAVCQSCIDQSMAEANLEKIARKNSGFSQARGGL
jgi:hypothetical protein